MYFHGTCNFPCLPPAALPAGRKKVSKAADKRNIKRACFMVRGQRVYAAGNMLHFLVLATLVLYGK